MLRDPDAVDPGALCARIGVDIPPDLLVECLTHRSYAYEQGGLRPNERLEFLGDAVLGLVITDALYHRHPDLPEGQLAKQRAAIVNAKALAAVARELSLGDYLSLGKGENATGGRDKTSILADALEALFGAVYLTGGIDEARRVIHDLMDPTLRHAASLDVALDWKTSLQELTSELGLGVPQYVLTEAGPDHHKQYTARVRLNDGLHGLGEGRTKKDAEQLAACATFLELRGEDGHAGTARG